MKKCLSVICAVTLLVSLIASFPISTLATGKGDYNNDGYVNTSDVRAMLRAIVNNATHTQQQLWWADYDCNGTIETGDARMALLDALYNVDGKAIDYTTTTNADWWGEKSVAVLGDSISFGAGCEGEIADYSYVGMVKKAVNAANGSTNYGFMSCYTDNWGPISSEICEWPERTTLSGKNDWECDKRYDGTGSTNDDGNRLMCIGMTSDTLWSVISYKLKAQYSYDYFCVYYHTEPNGGNFTLSDGVGNDFTDSNGVKTFITDNTVSETKRTGFFRLSDCPDKKIRICVGTSGKPVTITGIGFYNDISGNAVTFNKYCRGGAMLSQLSDTVLSQAASSGTLILGLGYNDALWGGANGYTKADFTSRIDHLISECNKNGTNVIVNDYLWSNYRDQAQYSGNTEAMKADIDEKFAFFHEELRRFARETGGIYVNQEARWGQLIIDEANANDGVHPTNRGHEYMATAIIEAMGLA